MKAQNRHSRSQQDSLVLLDQRDMCLNRTVARFLVLGCLLSLGLMVHPSPPIATGETSDKKQTDVSNRDNLANAKVSDADGTPQPPVRLSAGEILGRVADTYKKCSTYKDSGILIYEFKRNDGTRGIYRTAFRTAFRRGHQFAMGHRFRFAYRQSLYGRDYGPAMVLWHNGPKTITAREDRKGRSFFEKQESLGRAVAGLTGVSSGTALNISNLLLPDRIGGRRMVELATSRVPTLEHVEGRECYRIEGLRGKQQIVLWIDLDSYLIRRIEEHEAFDATSDSEITEYHPTINEEIPDALLEKQVAGEWNGLKKPGKE